MKLISIIGCWTFAAFIAWLFMFQAARATARCAVRVKKESDQ